MCPSFPGNDKSYCASAYVVLFCKLILRNIALLVPLAYLKDLFLRKFRVADMFPSENNSTILVEHIRNIVFLSAQEKMRRIDTTRIIAFMANKSAGRNIPIGNDPRKTVGKFYTIPFSSAHNGTITRPSLGTSPFPTFLWTFLFNISPKPFYQRVMKEA